VEKRWTRALIISGIVILLLITTGLVIPLVFGDRIKELAVRELNKKLATEVTVDGDINISVFQHFPYASIAFHQVQVKESLPEKSNLLSCNQVSLLFNLWDLIGSDYTIKKIVVEDGSFNVRKNSEGKNNYDIFKSDETGSGKEFSLAIKEAAFSNMLIEYTDERSHHHYVFNSPSTLLTGSFSSNAYLLSVNSDLTCQQFIIDNIDYFPNRKMSMNGDLQVIKDKNSYSFKNGQLVVEGNVFSVSGNIVTLENGNQLDLQVSGKDMRIEEIAALLPGEYKNYLSHYKSNGDIHFNAAISGMASATSTPHIEMQFTIKDGSLLQDKMKTAFENLNLSGVFTNGSANNRSTSVIELKNFSTSFDGNKVSGTLTVRNFNAPFLDLKINGEVVLGKIAPLLPHTVITGIDGRLDFRQFYFKGNLEDIRHGSKLNKMEAGGSFTLENVAITTLQTSYDHLNGSFDVNNNQVTINQLVFKANQSDLSFDGNVNNFIPYLVAALNDSSRNNQKIGLNLRLTSSVLKWEDLVGRQMSSTKRAADDSYSIPSLFYQVAGSVSGNIGKFSYGNFNCSAFHGNILFLGNKIYFNDFGMNAEKGQVTANGQLDITNVSRNRLDFTAKLDRLDISQLFFEFNDFGQTTLTHKNLKGTVTADVAVQSTWVERKLDKSKLYAVSDVVIDNGELNDFEPLMALAKFVRVTELKNIRFSRMQNQVEIKNEKIYIPTMQIYSNALNVQLSGTHSFENIIDYNVQLNLLRLLTSRFAKTSFEPEAVDHSTEGFLNLYLLMTGPASNPDIKYDKQAVKQKISADLKNEKNELKDVLKKEFDQQEQNKQDIKEWKAPGDIEYMEFEEDSLSAKANDGEKEISQTKQNQKKEFDDFKNIFKPKPPKGDR
jgi:uncharacterized protein involved in outer membrane biogenesis